MSRWHYGVMKEDLLPLRKGDNVVIGKSTLEFTHPTMGEGFWLLGVDSNVARLVADGDSSMGKGLSRLVRRVGTVETNKQERCTERAKILMPNSAYTPKNRRKQTYFFGGRPKKTLSGTEWNLQ